MLGFILGTFLSAHAMTSTDVLPQNVSSPQIKYGQISGIDQRYDSSGKLVNIRDRLTLNFDSQTLMKMTAKAKDLVYALNHVGQYKLGDQINLGTLKVDTEPHVSYIAPIFVHGISDQWSLAMGTPVITYENKIRVSQQGSNLDYYRSQLTGLNADLDKALKTDLIQEAVATLEQRGYKPVADRKETFFGDIQVSSLYRFWKTDKTALLYQAILNLPTGPKYDPDDLAALNSFGRTSVENKLAFSRRLKAFTLVPYTSFTQYIPDRVSMRVPENEDDVIPDSNTKETVEREIGRTLTLGHDAYYDVNDDFSVGLGYEFNFKQRDRYSGNEGRRYDLLEKDTNSQSQIMRGQLAYNTINAYLKKKSAIPTQVSYNYSDVVAGKNLARQTLHEFQFLLLF